VSSSGRRRRRPRRFKRAPRAGAARDERDPILVAPAHVALEPAAREVGLTAAERELLTVQARNQALLLGEAAEIRLGQRPACGPLLGPRAGAAHLFDWRRRCHAELWVCRADGLVPPLGLLRGMAFDPRAWGDARDLALASLSMRRSPDGCLALARSYIARGELERAWGLLEDVPPGAFDARLAALRELSRGAVHELRGELRHARVAFERAARHDRPGSYPWVLALAIALVRGDERAARRLLRHAPAPLEPAARADCAAALGDLRLRIATWRARCAPGAVARGFRLAFAVLHDRGAETARQVARLLIQIDGRTAS